MGTGATSTVAHMVRVPERPDEPLRRTGPGTSADTDASETAGPVPVDPQAGDRGSRRAVGSVR